MATTLIKMAATLCLLIACVDSMPPFFSDTSNEVDDGKIDLSSLGEKIYGLPKNSSGDNLEKWKPSATSGNAEEQSEYLQGDILFPPETKRNGLRAESARWPNGHIPYVIEGSYSGEYKENIMKAIADLHRLTCLRFVPYKGQKDYIAITSKKTGCWSSVGLIGGRQEVNLQNPGCVTAKGTVVHEFCHAAGFLHEQSRSNRDDFVTVFFQNIKKGEEHNFNKASAGSTNDFNIPYDYNSVMHYSANAFSANGQPTIQPKSSGAQLGQRQGLSRSDVKKINAMYKCNKPEPADGWSNDVWTG